MSNGYGRHDSDPYSAEDPWTRGVYPGRGGSGQPGAGHQQHGHQQHGYQQHGGQQDGSRPPGRRADGQGGGQPYGDIRNDYGRAPADTDAGRGGAHRWSVALVLLYFGLPLLVVGVIALVAVVVASA